MLIEDFLIFYLYWPAVPVVGVCEIEEIARPLSFFQTFILTVVYDPSQVPPYN